MTKQKFSPRTRKFDERKIQRSQKSFNRGMIRDVEPIDLPLNSVASLVNAKGFDNAVRGDTGSIEWQANLMLPAIADNTTFPVTLTPEMEGVSVVIDTGGVPLPLFLQGYSLFAYSDAGYQNQVGFAFIKSVPDVSKMEIDNYSIAIGEAISYWRICGKINARFFDEDTRAEYMLVGKEVYARFPENTIENGSLATDPFFYTKWLHFWCINSVFDEGRTERTISEIGDTESQFFKIGKKIVLSNTNGIFLLADVFSDALYTVRMNGALPALPLDKQGLDVQGSALSRYRYLYGYSRILGSSGGNRNTRNAIMEIETPPALLTDTEWEETASFKPFDKSRDFAQYTTNRPIRDSYYRQYRIGGRFRTWEAWVALTEEEQKPRIFVLYGDASNKQMHEVSLNFTRVRKMSDVAREIENSLKSLDVGFRCIYQQTINGNSEYLLEIYNETIGVEWDIAINADEFSVDGSFVRIIDINRNTNEYLVVDEVDESLVGGRYAGGDYSFFVDKASEYNGDDAYEVSQADSNKYIPLQSSKVYTGGYFRVNGGFDSADFTVFDVTEIPPSGGYLGLRGSFDNLKRSASNGDRVLTTGIRVGHGSGASIWLLGARMDIVCASDGLSFNVRTYNKTPNTFFGTDFVSEHIVVAHGDVQGDKSQFVASIVFRGDSVIMSANGFIFATIGLPNWSYNFAIVTAVDYFGIGGNTDVYLWGDCSLANHNRVVDLGFEGRYTQNPYNPQANIRTNKNPANKMENGEVVVTPTGNAFFSTETVYVVGDVSIESPFSSGYGGAFAEVQYDEETFFAPSLLSDGTLEVVEGAFSMGNAIKKFRFNPLRRDVTHYSLYRTRDIYPYTVDKYDLTDPRLTGTSPDMFGWVEDVPVCEIVELKYDAVGNYLYLNKEDYGVIGNTAFKAGDQATELVLRGFFPDGDRWVSMSYTMPASLAGKYSVGCETSFLAEKDAEGNIAVLGGASLNDFFTKQDEGSTIYWEDGFVDTIGEIEVVGGVVTSVKTLSNEPRLEQYIMKNPTERAYYDILNDNRLLGNMKVWALNTRFYKPLASSNIATYHNGIFVTAVRNSNEYSYSSASDFRHLGYHHSTKQRNDGIEKGIRCMLTVGDNICILTTSSTHAINPKNAVVIENEEFGEFFLFLPDPVMVNSAIGTTHQFKWKNGERGDVVIVTNEPAVRFFNGNTYDRNLADGYIQLSDINIMEEVIFMSYSNSGGIHLWGKAK